MCFSLVLFEPLGEKNCLQSSLTREDIAQLVYDGNDQFSSKESIRSIEAKFGQQTDQSALMHSLI